MLPSRNTKVGYSNLPLPPPCQVVEQLLAWFERTDLRDRVTRILLLWVNNHFTDFELDSDMMELLDGFESRLEGAKMQVFKGIVHFHNEGLKGNLTLPSQEVFV